ncbi:MAG TPA: hypothetical protein VHJ39_08955 [Solirubrobacteraceae bacterium]|jgi:drug/metabolite transporter (DMT)-like permease|nr:hypothetical protein [Solirubrobacteraceae bacterium]
MPYAARRPRLGYALAAVAAGMFALNGTLARYLLDDGVSAAHLSQLRATLAPVPATVMAWVIHGESLAAVQITGGLLVVAAVAWVQLHPPAQEVEAVPAWAAGPAQEEVAPSR